jgi:hypothetical protein
MGGGLCAVVEPVKSYELDGGVVFGLVDNRVAETGAAEQEQPGVIRAGFAAGDEQIADVLQFLQVAAGDGFLPLGLAEGGQCAASSSSVKTGTSLSPIFGGLRPATGLGRGSSGSSVACHLKNCCRARNWLLA